jgi:murein DD-endopeptidase MepM/ murein hydrolase activator NlpD
LSLPRLVILALVVLLAILTTASSPAFGAGLSDQIEAARERQQELAGSIARSEALLRDLRRDQAATQSAIATTERQLGQIDADLTRVKAQIERAEAALARTEARHAVLVEDLRQTDFTLGLLEQELASGEDDLQARRQALGERLADAYRTENTTLLEQVFTADSFSDVLSQASAYLAYGDQDAALVRAITQDQQALDTLRLLTAATGLRTDKLRRDTIETQQQIEARRAELAAARARLVKLEKRTERIQRAQKERYRELVKDERDAKRIVAEQVAAKQALQRRIAGLVRQAQAAASRRAGGGGGGPMIWPTTGIVTQGYGCTGFSLAPPRGSCPGFHDGIDIANATGTPIRAAADGVVAFIGYRIDGAFVVVMGHAGGLETVYGHMLPRYPVRAGQFVRQGTIIGYMGATGNVTGTHLHWEVSRGFSTLDPRAFV